MIKKATWRHYFCCERGFSLIRSNSRIRPELWGRFCFPSLCFWTFAVVYNTVFTLMKESVSVDAPLVLPLSCLVLQLMDATLSDTVGSQIINIKRNKSGASASSLPGPLVKSAMKPQPPQPPTLIRHNGDFTSASVLEPSNQGASSSLTVSTTAAAVTSVNSTNPPEIKPLVVLGSDVVTTTAHPAAIVPSSSLVSGSSFTDSVSVSPSLGWTSNTDLNSSRYVGRKIPSFSSGIIPFHLSTTPNPLSVSSSFPITYSCLSSTVCTTTSTTVAPGQMQKQNEWQSNTMLFQEILQRHEEQAYTDRVARRRTEAREKRRERREVRMAESLGRIATALELLSSKQDTIIALLQRLADRKWWTEADVKVETELIIVQWHVETSINDSIRFGTLIAPFHGL